MKRSFVFCALLLSSQGFAGEMRNSVSLGLELGAQHATYIVGGGARRVTLYGDLEYARVTALPNAEAIVVLGSRALKVKSSTGSDEFSALLTLQVGGRLFLSPRASQGWTPFLEATLGEGSLYPREGQRSTYRGYMLGAGMSRATEENREFRVLLSHDRYVAQDSASSVGTMAGFGAQWVFVQRFE